MTDNQRRKFLKLVGASLAGTAGVSILGCENRPDKIGSPNPGPINPKDMPGIMNPTRKKLIEHLKKLAESEPPTDLAHGAMCYEPCPPPERKEMPCPDCGRTMIEDEMKEILSAYEIPLRRIQAQGLDVKLIHPEHCPKCGFGLAFCGLDWKQIEKLSPEDRKARKSHLEIKYRDESDPIRIELDHSFDLEIMALFLQGKDRYPAGYESEEALKVRVGRLRELFGVADE